MRKHDYTYKIHMHTFVRPLACDKSRPSSPDQQSLRRLLPGPRLVRSRKSTRHSNLSTQRISISLSSSTTIILGNTTTTFALAHETR
jgi:hypothetical protein